MRKRKRLKKMKRWCQASSFGRVFIDFRCSCARTPSSRLVIFLWATNHVQVMPQKPSKKKLVHQACLLKFKLHQNRRGEKASEKASGSEGPAQCQVALAANEPEAVETPCEPSKQGEALTSTEPPKVESEGQAVLGASAEGLEDPKKPVVPDAAGSEPSSLQGTPQPKSLIPASHTPSPVLP